MAAFTRARAALTGFVLVFFVGAGPALADRGPTLEERDSIEQALRVQGFVRWGDIDLDESEGVWEVEDALSVDGREYDLKLRAATLEVVDREEN